MFSTGLNQFDPTKTLLKHYKKNLKKKLKIKNFESLSIADVSLFLMLFEFLILNLAPFKV